MSFSAVKKVNVSDEVYKQILGEILQKKLRPGDKMPSEAELVRQFGVSRISVRAALQKLAGAGIIEIINGEGAFVKYADESPILGNMMALSVLEDYDAMQLLDFRRGIEMVSAELAARNGSHEEIEQLQKIFDSMTEADKSGNAREYSEWDSAFHMQVAKMTKNKFIIYTMEQIQPAFMAHMERLNLAYGSSDGYAFHRRLLEMLAKHDQEGAVVCMRETLLHTQKRILEQESAGQME